MVLLESFSMLILCHRVFMFNNNNKKKKNKNNNNNNNLYGSIPIIKIITFLSLSGLS